MNTFLRYLRAANEARLRGEHELANAWMQLALGALARVP